MIDLSTGKVEPTSNDLCSDLSSDVLSQINSLDDILTTMKTGSLAGVKDKLSDLATNGTINDVDDLIGSSTDTLDKGISGLGDMINDTANGNVGDRSVQSILDCINSLTDMNASIPKLNLPSTPTVGNLGGLVGSVTDGLFSYLSDSIDSALDPYQSAAANALQALSSLVPKDLIDKLLHVIQCLEDCVGSTPPSDKPGAQLYDVWCYDDRKGYKVWAENVQSVADIDCPNDPQHKISYTLADPTPTMIDIEDKLFDAGLTINAEPDWASPTWSDLGITEAIGENLGKLVEAKTNLAESLAEVKNIDILGEPPELPEVARLPNTLKNLSLTDKIKQLF